MSRTVYVNGEYLPEEEAKVARVAEKPLVLRGRRLHQRIDFTRRLRCGRGGFLAAGLGGFVAVQKLVDFAHVASILTCTQGRGSARPVLRATAPYSA